jgi:transcriptional regulator with XRE-family HTH domain
MTRELKPEFTKLENSTIGRNIATYRRIRDMKAADMAQQLGMKEAAYSKYERGETALTIPMIQKIADIIRIDPIQLMTVSPGHLIENGNYSPMAVQTNSTFHCYDVKQSQAIVTLINSQVDMNRKLVELMAKQ